VLWTLTFDRAGVAISDLYFVDPNLDQGDDGAERGVRLELRLFEREELKGSVYSAVPIRVDRPIWRVDMLETVDSTPGSLNRAHHHPRFHGWEPGRRVFDEALSADPRAWIRAQLADIEGVLDRAGVDVAADLGPTDVESLRASAERIASELDFQLAEVAAGRAGLAPDGAGDFVRQSWL
jgi:hypothetical protein